MQFTELDLAFFVKVTLCVVHEDHGTNKESRLLLEKLISLNQKTMKLIAIWRLNQQSLLKECLPFAGELSFNEVGYDEVLFVFGTFYLEVWHFLVSS